MKHKLPVWSVVLAAMVLASGFWLTAAQAPSSAPAKSTTQGATPAQPGTPAGPSTAAWRGSQVRGLSQRAEMYYESAWGVGDFHVKVAESGELIRFDYRVLDPVKAATLNDKKFEPELDDAQARIKLSIPQMEKVGKLRQQSTPKAGMVYWMAFANPTLQVKRGHRVDVVIGGFRATNLVVE